MKKTLCRLIMAASLPVIIQTASADVLLTDDFTVSSNSQNVNQELAGRQTGPLAPAYYTGVQIHHQVGNTTTDVGQPGGATNGNYVLLAFDGCFFSDLALDALTSGPLTIEFDMYVGGTSSPTTDPTTWVACCVMHPDPSDFFPVVPTAGEFGFLVRNNGGVQVFQNNGSITPNGFDTPGFASSNHWTLIFSDTTGTNSAFNGNGSQVTMMNGSNILGTIALSQLDSAGLRLGFRDAGSRFGGISNLKISGTPSGRAPAGQNLSFEYDTTLPGDAIQRIPTSWTAFNQNAWGDFGSQNGGGIDYTVFSPLAAPADGNQFCYINIFSGNPTGGIYQDMGPMQSNTIYTLTVAIGSRADRINSPGIIQLVNGVDDTGTVLATGGGLPDTQDTWQDYTISFTNGVSTSGDLIVVLSVMGAGTIQADFDNVRLTNAPAPAVIPPTLLTDVHPFHSRVIPGAPMALSVAANGSLPLSYQWFLENSPISGATNSSYSFDALAGTKDYYVTVTNSGGGVVSSTAYVVAATNIVTVQNFSFENGTTGSGLLVIPVSWTSFNDNNFSTVAGNGYSVTNPLAPPADGNYFFAINEGPSDPTGGIYQDVGALLPNTTYTLTVAIGLSVNFTPGVLGSPGIISLINGTDDTGLLLASTNGVPDTSDTWQDYTVSFTTGPSVSGDLTVALSVAGASTYQAHFDDVQLTQAPNTNVIPPTLLLDIHPLQSEVTTGAPWTLSATVNGYPLYYQWYNQGGPISSATNSSYSFAAVAGTNYYQVIATNSAGSVTSSIATVLSAPNFVTVNNYSFENGTTGGGQLVIPVSWTGFDDNNFSTVADNSYSVVDPLAAPAEGNDFFAINEGPSDPTGGIYQDVGALLPNTAYTLTVAIGLREDFTPGVLGSPGIISLINGANNAGALLASTSGVPATPDTWQDYAVNFTTGPSVSGDLTVELSVAGASTYQANFDNVQLTETPVFQFAPPTVSGGKLILKGGRGTAGAGYTLLTTTNLSAPIIWTTNSTGILDGTGAFSNSIPVVGPARFYLMLFP